MARLPPRPRPAICNSSLLIWLFSKYPNDFNQLRGAETAGVASFPRRHPSTRHAPPASLSHRLASAPDRALGADIERIERVARRHEQAVALDAAEAEVGGALGQRD